MPEGSEFTCADEVVVVVGPGEAAKGREQTKGQSVISRRSSPGQGPKTEQFRSQNTGCKITVSRLQKKALQGRVRCAITCVRRRRAGLQRRSVR